jgi:hypothetical protein
VQNYMEMNCDINNIQSEPIQSSEIFGADQPRQEIGFLS